MLFITIYLVKQWGLQKGLFYILLKSRNLIKIIIGFLLHIPLSFLQSQVEKSYTEYKTHNGTEEGAEINPFPIPFVIWDDRLASAVLGLRLVSYMCHQEAAVICDVICWMKKGSERTSSSGL